MLIRLKIILITNSLVLWAQSPLQFLIIKSQPFETNEKHFSQSKKLKIMASHKLKLNYIVEYNKL